MGLAPPGRNPGYAAYQTLFHHTPRSPVGKPAQSAPVALWRIFAHRPMMPGARHPNSGAKAAARLVSPRQGIIIIIVYAAGKPSFVIDSYTRRIVGRMGLAPPGRSPGYGAYQTLFHRGLRPMPCCYRLRRRKPSFVIDSYTRRIVDRMGFAPPGRKPGYAAYQAFFHRGLPDDAALFNEFHALLDHHAKIACRKTRPICAGCVLADLCPTAVVPAVRHPNPGAKLAAWLVSPSSRHYHYQRLRRRETVFRD